MTPVTAQFFCPTESVAVTDGLKLVLFDMDNVLCDYDRGERVRCLAELAGTTSDAVYKAIWESGFEFLGDSGALDAADYLQGFGQHIGYPLSLEEWVEARRRSMKANSAMLEVADRLRETVDIAVLTNNTTLVADHIDTLLPELRPLFGPKFTRRHSARRPSRTRAATVSACRSYRRHPQPSCSSTTSRQTLRARWRQASSRIITPRCRLSGRRFRGTACSLTDECARPASRQMTRHEVPARAFLQLRRTFRAAWLGDWAAGVEVTP